MVVAPDRNSASSLVTARAASSSDVAAADSRIVFRIPPPDARIDSYVAPEVRASKSPSRSPAQTACVCGSTSPGTTARPPTSTVSAASPVQSLALPPHAIASAAQSTTVNARIAEPRLGAAPLAVASWEIPLISKSTFITNSAYPIRALAPFLSPDHIRHPHGEPPPEPDRSSSTFAVSHQLPRCRRPPPPVPHAGCSPSPLRRHDENSPTPLRSPHSSQSSAAPNPTPHLTHPSSPPSRDKDSPLIRHPDGPVQSLSEPSPSHPLPSG